MSDEFVIRECVIAEDAEKLAAMWKASDDQWPGTWSGGTEITPEMIVEWFERESMINVSVVETADGSKIVGYCSFNERTEEKNVGYVDLLNVQPDYQKKSLARRLLQDSVQRCVDLGFHLLTLGTWSGNLKAMPLYKKVGFNWMPDTSVWMLNFMPAVLALPAARGYFSRHDWYRTLKRELKQVEDDERWEGMKVLTYRFEENGEALTVWGDREAWRITAVETDAFFAGAIADNIEPPKGMATEMRWRFTNKQAEAVSVSLIASGTEHLKLNYRATKSVAPGESLAFSAPVDVSLETPEVRKSGWVSPPVPTVKTIWIIDGEVLELGTGMRPQPAVAVSTHPEYVTLTPGVEQVVTLQLKSYIREEAAATVTVTPAPGLTVDWTSRDVSLPAKGWAGGQITLKAEASGVYPLNVSVTVGEATTKPERIAIFALPPGGVLADVGEKEARLENAGTRVLAHVRGGGTGFHTPVGNHHLGSLQQRLGPPFWPSEFSEKDFEVQVCREADGNAAVLTAASDTYAGLVLRQTIRLGGGPLVRVSSELVNQGTTVHEIKMSRRIWPGESNRATITVPLAQGIVRERMSEYPAAEEDIPKKPEAFAERWISAESSHGTLGVLWNDAYEELDFSWGLECITATVRCEPMAWTDGGELTIYAGAGSWRDVRDQARRLAGESEPEETPVSTRRAHGARLEPAPVVTVDDAVAAQLVVDNLRKRPLIGNAELVLPEGATADRTSFLVEDVSVGSPLREPVELTLGPKPAAYAAEIALEGRVLGDRLPAPIIRLGTRRVVDVTVDDPCTIDNCMTRFTIAPGFTGALTSWVVDGVNQLLSPYPEQATFGWMSPWYGGITPMVTTHEDDFPGKLDQETLTAEAVSTTDERGIAWSGVRVKADLTREKLEGLSVAFDYLTVGQSNVLKLVCTCTNTTSAARRLGAGWFSYWGFGGDGTANVLDSAEIQRRPNPWSSWPKTGHWGAVTANGRTAIIVAPYPGVNATDWGDRGSHLGYMLGVTVKPESTWTRTAYLVLCDSLEAAKRYVPLKDT